MPSTKSKTRFVRSPKQFIADHFAALKTNAQP